MLARVYRVIKNELKIVLSGCPPRFRSLRSLSSLNSLRIEVPLILTVVLAVTMIEDIEPTATIKSKAFHPSFQ